MMPIPQTLGRRRLAAMLIAASSGGGAILLAMATPGVARPRPEASPPADWRRVGSSSCAARGCHGAVGPTDPASGDVYIKDGASTTWRYYDPHARAFDVLLGGRSLAMAEKLKETLGNKPAHESRTCLVCHATVDPAGTVPGARAEPAEGISCEACHGPAEAWQEAHLSPKWREDATARAAAGMTDLSDASGRSRACVGCHVGDRSRGMDVNHDLIAAGHPRLNFEYSAYLEAYPRHWREKPGAAPSPVGDWAIGQAVTARAAIQLLGDRARSSVRAKEDPPAAVAPWPELSESECFACHHGLGNPGWIPDRGAFAVRPGRLPWATWTSAMLPELEKVHPGWKLDLPGSPWADLRAEMTRKQPDPAKVADLSRGMVDLIGGWLERPKGTPPTGPEIVSLTRQLAEGWPDRPESWDQLAQRTMTIAAMTRAGKALGGEPTEIAEALKVAWKKLGFRRGFDSPIGGKPAVETGP